MWHSFFSQSFRFLAYEPVVAFFGPKRKTIGRMVGTILVFGLSGLIHEQGGLYYFLRSQVIHQIQNLVPRNIGIFSATYHIPISIPPRPFLVRHGGSIFFFSQAVGIILEGVWISLTRRKVKGFWGGLWTMIVIGGMGIFVLSPAWFVLLPLLH